MGSFRAGAMCDSKRGSLGTFRDNRSAWFLGTCLVLRHAVGSCVTGWHSNLGSFGKMAHLMGEGEWRVKKVAAKTLRAQRGRGGVVEVCERMLGLI